MQSVHWIVIRTCSPFITSVVILSVHHLIYGKDEFNLPLKANFA